MFDDGTTLEDRCKGLEFAKNQSPGVTSLGRREGLLFGLAPLAEVASRELSWDPTASHRELIWAQVCSGNSW